MLLDRRSFLAVGVALLISGCSATEIALLNTAHSLGDTVSIGEIDLTAETVEKTEVLTIVSTGGMNDRQREFQAPPGGIFALFKLRAENTDITARAAPAVNPLNYDRVKPRDDNELLVAGRNAIRVYGSGDGGYLPETELGNFPIYDSIRFNGRTVSPYPTRRGSHKTQLDPSEEVSGWVFGVIERDTTPQLKIVFGGSEIMWSADG